jgi:hypothetical protein
MRPVSPIVGVVVEDQIGCSVSGMPLRLMRRS